MTPNLGASFDDDHIPEPGRVTSGAEHCANVDCQRPFDAEYGFYLYRDLEKTTGGMCVFCHDCSVYVELNAPERFRLVAL